MTFSYLKRGSTIITIEESMLPAGMFAIEELEPKVHKLYQGDFLIMMTDGVLEALHAENKDQMMKGIYHSHCCLYRKTCF